MKQGRGSPRWFEREVRRALIAAGLDPYRSGHLLAAVSGGADSTALLLALCALKGAAAGRGTEVSACYVDHGLRTAAERQSEMMLLEDLCHRLEIRLTIVAVDVAAERMAGKRSWEDAARRCRYAALSEAATTLGGTAVVSGHTLDDQVETVLLRLMRGTGPRGLRGIDAVTAPWGPDHSLLVRPLLTLTHIDAMQYCRARGQPWCEDSSNGSPAFRRNRVRAELVPLLREIFPGSEASIARLARQSAEFSGWIDAEVAAVLAALWRRDVTKAFLARPQRPLPAFLAAQVIAAVLAGILDGSGAPSERLVQAMCGLWSDGSGRLLDLGNDWRAESGAGGVRLRQAKTSGDTRWREGHWKLDVGSTEIPGWRVDVQRCPAVPVGNDAADFDNTMALVAYVSADDADDLSVRFWRPGVRMRPAGMAQDKKLQDIFVDEKVPREQRHRTPLLYHNGSCIWAIGVKRSALAAGKLGKGNSLRVAFEPNGVGKEASY